MKQSWLRASATLKQSSKSFDISRGTVDLNTGCTTAPLLIRLEFIATEKKNDLAFREILIA